ncbi:MAG: hypothetical protein KF781_06330 [Chitinophagaceae bacterium]|nr:hypothetical protein [Chitinophagaceae bacterium]MCW5904162.1 hypothetical protein [Chitinophagaceae bacterium]
MNKIFLLIATLFFYTLCSAQKNKYDTTLKVGKNGFRVLCSNKSSTKNALRISPIGFEEVNDDIHIDIKGKVFGAEIDDLNKDGFNDLVVYILTDEKKRKGTVLAIASDENKRIMPITFPEVLSNEKLKVGYDGDDSFKLLNGTLTHKFSVNDTTSHSENPIIARQVLYNVVKGDYGNWKFKVQRIVDIFKQ